MNEKNGEELFESTYKNGISSGYKKKEIFLEEGERIIGYKSRKAPYNTAAHFDF